MAQVSDMFVIPGPDLKPATYELSQIIIIVCCISMSLLVGFVVCATS